ncbi:MAG: asparagine synthase-related protein [Clostridiaceae bacterium]
MSGIFGFINLDGRPAAPEHFRAMSDEMAKWGPDGVGTTFSGNAAFGHALLIVTHESRFEKMPYCDQNEGTLFTAAARLDNRDELCDVFGIAHPERPITSDGQLVLKAYKKWGTDSCKHIFGDWSFAVWHIKEQRLFLARDHLGNTGLYYYFKPPLVIFASSTEAILSHPDVPRRLDELQLAKNLDFSLLDDDYSRTFWKEICFLPALYSMTVKQAKVETEKYWYLENAPPIRFGSNEEYLEGFLEHFRRAVRVRLNSVRPIGTQLSAGLDSSSVTALAAEALLETSQPLVAYTSVPLHPAEKLFPGNLTDEWPLAHSVAECYDNIEHIPIRAEDISPLAAVKQILKILYAPQHAAANMFWIVSIFENARRCNLGVMLTGQLGNGGVSWSGGRDYIFYLFAHNQWQKGWHALNAWKVRHGFSWFRAVKSQLLRPVLSPLWHEFQNLLHPATKLFYSFPQRDFFKRLGLNKPGHLTSGKRIDPLTERMLTIIRNGTMAGPIWHSFGSFHNLETRDPTADVRLLEYCMGMPDEQNTFEGGERMLIRRAMASILPDTVRWNTIRGKQAADADFRLIHQREELEREFALLETAPIVTQYLDVQTMKHTWEALLSPNTRTPPWAANALMRAMNTGLFLLSFSGHSTECGAPSCRSRRLPIITQPPASHGAFLPQSGPGDSKSQD